MNARAIYQPSSRTVLFRFLIVLSFLATPSWKQVALSQGSIRDVFPLSINSIWNYNYRYDLRYDNIINNEHIRQSDSGIVSYRVIDSVSQSDWIQWSVQVVRNFRRWTGGDTTFMIADTTLLSLQEYSSSEHRIIMQDTYRRSSVWVFLSWRCDSTVINRYQITDSMGRARLSACFPNGFLGTQRHYQYDFRPDTGMVSAFYFVFLGDGLETSQSTLIDFTITGVPSYIENQWDSSTPHLRPNYPNPFNPSTTIEYALPRKGHVTLKIYDLIGREVATLIDSEEEAGHHDVRWIPSSTSSGVYFYRLQAGNYVQTRKLIFLK